MGWVSLGPWGAKGRRSPLELVRPNLPTPICAPCALPSTAARTKL